MTLGSSKVSSLGNTTVLEVFQRYQNCPPNQSHMSNGHMAPTSHLLALRPAFPLPCTTTYQTGLAKGRCNTQPIMKRGPRSIPQPLTAEALRAYLSNALISETSFAQQHSFVRKLLGVDKALIWCPCLAWRSS
jgi:hypothetical protein